MNEPENLQIVKQLYDAMAQRDFPRILNQLTEDVSWYGLVLEGSWQAKILEGKEQVADFLESSIQVMDRQWLPETFFSQGDRVVVLGRGKYQSKRTGYRFENDWVHVFIFREGKIAELRRYLDAIMTLAALG
jgi:ketosteroid isomerase-like protein